MKIAIFFFSGTGNTYFVSLMMQKALSSFSTCDLYAIENLNTEVNSLIKGYDMIGLGFPVYGSSLPDIVFSWIDQLDHHEKKAFVFCTQMMYSGDGAAYAGRLLHRKGFQVKVQEHFNMPNNIIDLTIFKRKKPYSYEKIYNYVFKKTQKCKYLIENNRSYLKGSNLVSLFLGLLQRVPKEYYEKKVISKFVKIDDSKCIQCGECVDLCPVHNLSIDSNRITQQGICIICYRCINHCPQNAITFFGRNICSTPYLGPTIDFNILDAKHHQISTDQKE